MAGGGQTDSDQGAMFFGAAALAVGSPFLVGAHKGNQKINDCRMFNARLLELRGGDAVGQATYNWLDEFSPVPDFGVASQNLPAIIPPVRGFSSVFSGSIRNSSEDLEGRGKKRPKPQEPQEPPTQPAR